MAVAPTSAGHEVLRVGDPRPRHVGARVGTQAPNTSITSGPSGATSDRTHRRALLDLAGLDSIRVPGPDAAARHRRGRSSSSNVPEGAHTSRAAPTDGDGHACDARRRSPSRSRRPAPTRRSPPALRCSGSTIATSACGQLGSPATPAADTAKLQCKLDGGSFATARARRPSRGSAMDPTRSASAPSTLPATRTPARPAAPSRSIRPRPTRRSPPALHRARPITTSASSASADTPAADGEAPVRSRRRRLRRLHEPEDVLGPRRSIHTVSFRAVDAAGDQDPSPASRSFTVDTGPSATASPRRHKAKRARRPSKGEEEAEAAKGSAAKKKAKKKLKKAKKRLKSRASARRGQLLTARVSHRLAMCLATLAAAAVTPVALGEAGAGAHERHVADVATLFDGRCSGSGRPPRASGALCCSRPRLAVCRHRSVPPPDTASGSSLGNVARLPGRPHQLDSPAACSGSTEGLDSPVLEDIAIRRGPDDAAAGRPAAQEPRFPTAVLECRPAQARLGPKRGHPLLHRVQALLDAAVDTVTGAVSPAAR